MTDFNFVIFGSSHIDCIGIVINIKIIYSSLADIQSAPADLDNLRILGQNLEFFEKIFKISLFLHKLKSIWCNQYRWVRFWCFQSDWNSCLTNIQSAPADLDNLRILGQNLEFFEKIFKISLFLHKLKSIWCNQYRWVRFWCFQSDWNSCLTNIQSAPADLDKFGISGISIFDFERLYSIDYILTRSD